MSRSRAKRVAPVEHPVVEPKALRLALGMSLVRAAGLADVSPASVRIFELDPLALSEPCRRKVARFYAEMKRQFERVRAA